MSFFGVTIETISNIRPIAGADKIELASLEGSTFQFVVGKDAFKNGESVLYFPVDSVISDATIAKLGLTGKLAGSQHNRVKTVKLRGQYSQGIVAKLNLLEGIPGLEPSTHPVPTTEEITAFLGVHKFDPEENMPLYLQNNAYLRSLPGTSVYDIEGIDKFPDLVEKLMGLPVQISEKMEGSHASFTFKKIGDTYEFYVCQRRHSIVPKEGETHPYWVVAERLGIQDALKTLRDAIGCDSVTLRGEMVGPGIQGNYYRLKEHDLYVFDVEI